MYGRVVQSQLGCSVKELSGLYGATPEKLRELTNQQGITICVTGGGQKKEHEALKKAGFVPLIEYSNYVYGAHDRCRLWVAVNRPGGKKQKMMLLPDTKELEVDDTAETTRQINDLMKISKTLADQQKGLVDELAALKKEKVVKSAKRRVVRVIDPKPKAKAKPKKR
jgi:hypothetical protein